MKITSDSETLAENKVLILYVLSNVNKPITNDALYSIISSAVDLNYFYFQQFLLDLIEVKYVVCFEKETQSVYEITDAGRNTLDLTLDINFKSSMESFENAQSIIAEFTPKSESEYEVQCKIVEDGEVVFEVKTFAYSREQAQNIVQNWKSHANNLYPQILDILVKNNNNSDK